MKHLKLFEEFSEINSEEYPLLIAIIEKTWDGDISFEEAIDGFSSDDLKSMEATLHNYETVFNEGVPFPGDNESYDELLKNNNGAKLLQKMIDTQE